MGNVVDRIARLMADRGMTVTAFSRIVDINQSNLSRKMRNVLPITERDIYKICKYLGVNEDWLTTGSGEIYTEQGMKFLSQGDTGKPVGKIQYNNPREEKKVPFYDVEFELGFDEMFNDEPNVPSSYISVPGYEKADFWCRASGESMKPYINSGNYVALKEVEGWQDYITMNEAYAIVTRNGLRTIKVIRKGSDERHFTLHAYNEDFEDQEVDKANIIRIFKVIGILKAL